MKVAWSALTPERVLGPVRDLIPDCGTVLDVGAGTGHIASWLTARGCNVVAVEPVAELWQTPGLRRITDTLPKLATIEGPFDMILLSGVWHHLDASARAVAWDRLAALLATEGQVLMSFRHGPSPENRPAFPIDLSKERAAALRSGLAVTASRSSGSIQATNKAAGVTWTWLALKHSARPRAKV
ncbi:MAG: methyltransferase domain-containing protein [Pseudomonadota bacterium]